MRPSPVQIAPETVQSVVAGSVMVTVLLFGGLTVIVQVWLLPCTLHF